MNDRGRLYRFTTPILIIASIDFLLQYMLYGFEKETPQAAFLCRQRQGPVDNGALAVYDSNPTNKPFRFICGIADCEAAIGLQHTVWTHDHLRGYRTRMVSMPIILPNFSTISPQCPIASD